MYNRRDLVRAHLGAQQRGFGGYYAESPTFNAALEAHYLEAGLIHRNLEEAGEQGARVNRASERINAAVDDAREGHLEMLDAVVAAMLGDRADLTFAESDVRSAGIDVVAEPNPTDYPLFDA
jgi:hypothetical protein